MLVQCDLSLTVSTLRFWFIDLGLVPGIVFQIIAQDFSVKRTGMNNFQVANLNHGK